MAERILPAELVAAAIGYALLIMRRSAAPARRIEFGRAVSFLAGIGVLAIALCGPIDSESGRRLTWHMTQHVLLISVAAPLLAIGRPVELVVEAIRPGLRRWSPNAARSSMTAASGFVALAVLFAWHAPLLYEAALESETVHIVEHLTLLLSWMLLWANLLQLPSRGASVVWLFVVTLPTNVFGLAMTIARTPWYSSYVTNSRPQALRDQQLAGVVMWAFGGLAALTSGVGLFAAWLTAFSSGSEPEQHPTSDPIVADVVRSPKC